MDPAVARHIIEALADGVDPRTGEVLPSGSPIDSTEVILALHVALSAIDSRVRSARSATLPSNAGEAWCQRDDRELAGLFDAGYSVADIARTFDRTRASIAARLVRLGKAPDRQPVYRAKLLAASNGH